MPGSSLVAVLLMVVASALPPGFSRSSLPTGQEPGTLTDFAFLPDGTMVTAGKTGLVTAVAPGGGVVRLGNIAVDDTQDVGLIGLEPGPRQDRPELYTAYTYRGADGAINGRVTRWTIAGQGDSRALRDERVVLDGIPIDSPYHAVNTVLAAPDGTLFVSVGDGAMSTDMDPLALRAQDLDSPNGKVLRLDTTGAGVPKNPFFDPARPRSWRSRVYALGFRNPFRMTLASDGSLLYIGDVGRDLWEEIDIVRPGDNLGWPCWEGPVRTAGYRDLRQCARLYHEGEARPPAFAYPIDVEGASVTAGVFATHRYPDGYADTFFFADYTQGRISTLDLTAGDAAPEAHLFAEGIGHPVRFRVGPEGDVYYADIASARVWRVRYGTGPSPSLVAGLVLLGALLLSVGRRATR